MVRNIPNGKDISSIVRKYNLTDQISNIENLSDNNSKGMYFDDYIIHTTKNKPNNSRFDEDDIESNLSINIKVPSSNVSYINKRIK